MFLDIFRMGRMQLSIDRFVKWAVVSKNVV